MAAVFAERELYQACRVIFGSELTVSREFLEYLQMSGVKSAFRKRVFETHPDKLADRSELVKKRGAVAFLSVKQAYEKLAAYVDARENGFCFKDSSCRTSAFSSFKTGNASGRRRTQKPRPAQSSFHQNKPQPERRKTQHSQRQQTTGSNASKSGYPKKMHKGAVPARHLLFGHYLYYSGLISWQGIVQALVWQRSHKRRIGEVAVERGWMTKKDVYKNLRNCSRTDLPFGQQALSNGFLSRTQVICLLNQQKRRQKRLGSFFIEKKVLSPQQLSQLLVGFHRHNARFTSGLSKN